MKINEAKQRKTGGKVNAEKERGDFALHGKKGFPPR